MKSKTSITLPEIQRYPENCLELMRNLSSPAIAIKAGEAIHLLNRIIFECLNQKSDAVIIIMKDLAVDLGVSKQTMSTWHKRLQKEELVTRIKVGLRVKIRPVDIINPRLILRENIVQNLESTVNFQISDLLSRISKLESHLH
jgi:hypothetical protein